MANMDIGSKVSMRICKLESSQLHGLCTSIHTTMCSSQYSVYGLYILQCFSVVGTCGVNEFKSLESGLCCPLCPPGKHHIKDCRQGSSTLCQPCPEDQFTAIPNNLTSCENCASVKCDSASGRILKQCTPTSNSRCECPDNKYWNSDTLRCKDCKICNSGEQVTAPCKTDEDTKCEKCPEVGRN